MITVLVDYNFFFYTKVKNFVKSKWHEIYTYMECDFENVVKFLRLRKWWTHQWFPLHPFHFHFQNSNQKSVKEEFEIFKSFHRIAKLNGSVQCYLAKILLGQGGSRRHFAIPPAVCLKINRFCVRNFCDEWKTIITHLGFSKVI